MLSDLAIFTEYTYAAATQVVAQQVVLFNQAAQGTFTLQAANHAGDFSERAFWARFPGLVRRRNPYGAGTIPQVNIAMLVDNMVKIAAGTPEVRMDPGQFEWINANQQVVATALGQQLAEEMVRDMFNVALSALIASHIQVPGLTVNKSTEGLKMQHFNAAQAKYGDRYRDIRAWVMHSGAMFGLFDNVFANNERLFDFGTLNVQRDPFGRAFIVSDAPALYIPPVPAGANNTPPAVPAYYYTLGVTPGAAQVDQNDDFTDNWDTKNGDENIIRTYQAEWSYNLGIKGFSWDKQAGGKAPTDAALVTAANWDRVQGYNDRDLGCVILKTQ